MNTKSYLPTGRYVAAAAVLLISLSGMVHAAPARKKPVARGSGAAAGKPATAATSTSGEQIYKSQCAACHGAKGEGAKAYPKPLVGTQSPGQLARFIAASMPPGASPKMPAAQAQKVAAFVHDAFYSPIAQARNRPARVELSRLTVGQYRQVLSDLIGSFRKPGEVSGARGLTGVYFAKRRFNPRDKVLERVDPQIQFDFGLTAPQGGEADPYEFAIRWEGALLPPETGEYEFIIRGQHAMRLWVNDLEQPLVDAYVRSGDDDEFRGRLFLVAGRTYPLRLDFSKAKQGVNDADKLKEKPVLPAAVALDWRMPNREQEAVPARVLLPVTVPERFVSTAPFPPDDRSRGYELGSTISRAWEEATTEGAIEAAGYVSDHLNELAGVKDGAEDRPARLREFCRRFAALAFRRPLTPDLERIYIDRQFSDAPNPETAVRRTVLLTLKSPRFLYRELEGSGADAYDVASRLSFGLWDSLPDDELLKAAASGELSTPDQVERQAERMLNDPRARAKMHEFMMRWLKVDHHPDLAKDASLFPGFDAAVASDLRTSLELGVEGVVWSEKSSFQELMLSDKVYLNGRLAKLYGAPLPPDAPFQPAALDPGRRAGILTHPYLLAGFAYTDTSSPIHRGVLLARSVLGRSLQPPPEAFTPVAASLHPDMTTRQRVAMQTKPAACASCHDMINPLGFTLESFDAVGRYRTKENGKPVNSSGSYRTRTGDTVKFDGALELARFVAQSEESQQAFVERLFLHLVKQPPLAFGPHIVTELQSDFKKNQYSIRRQMVRTMTRTALSQ